MKNIIFFLLMFLLSNISYCQEFFDEASMTIEAENIMNEANSRIVKIDSTTESDTRKTEGIEKPIFDIKWKRIRSYDLNNKLIKEETKALNNSSTASLLPSILIFDTNDNCILECRNDSSGITWLLALLKYDEKGVLTEKKFWNEESIGKMVYDSPENPKKYTFYNSKGEKIKSWRKARRNIPYKKRN